MWKARTLGALMLWARVRRRREVQTQRSGEAGLCPSEDRDYLQWRLLWRRGRAREALFMPGIRAPGLWLLVFRDKLIWLIW